MLSIINWKMIIAFHNSSTSISEILDVSELILKGLKDEEV